MRNIICIIVSALVDVSYGILHRNENYNLNYVTIKQR